MKNYDRTNKRQPTLAVIQRVSGQEEVNNIRKLQNKLSLRKNLLSVTNKISY